MDAFTIYIYIYMGQIFQAVENPKMVSLYSDLLQEITNILVEIFGFRNFPRLFHRFGSVAMALPRQNHFWGLM